jgi:hypothetical protein
LRRVNGYSNPEADSDPAATGGDRKDPEVRGKRDTCWCHALEVSFIPVLELTL